MPDDQNGWADDMIAGPMGFKYCVLFPRGRDALHAYTAIKPIKLPTNVCFEAWEAARHPDLVEIDNCGLAPGTQLYGYRKQHDCDLDLDPLMTGWLSRPCSESSIISFGRKKMVELGTGGAFLTNSLELAEQMKPLGYWSTAWTFPLIKLISHLPEVIERRWQRIYWWDRHLGDCLTRIPGEQIIPWRLIRWSIHRDSIVNALRIGGVDAGINYPKLFGKNDWGDGILNLFVSDDYDEARIRSACEIIKRAA